MKYSRSKKAVAVGEMLTVVKGFLAKSPEATGGLRTVWEVHEKCSHGMLLVLWVSLAREVYEITPNEAPVKLFLRSVLNDWDALMQEGTQKNNGKH